MGSIKVLILGLGQVVIGYDVDKPNKGIKTHLFAIHEYGKLENINFEIFAVDPDPEKRQRATKFFPKIRCFSDLSEVSQLSFDLVINAVPIPNLLSATEAVLENFRYNFLFIEKPGVETQSQALIFNELIAQHQNVHIIYPRRVLKSTDLLRELLKSDGYNNRTIKINYSGTPENILTHFLDLVDAVVPEKVEFNFYNSENLKISQTSDTNNNDHMVIFDGAHRIIYGKGGMEIIDSSGKSFDFTAEIESQIWHTAKSYLNLVRGLESSRFPTEISQLVNTALGVRNG